MKALIESLFIVLKHLFMRPVTLEYPEKKRALNSAFRGKLEVNGCVGCGICKRVCPSGAIEYDKDDNGKVISYRFDLKKCIFCGNCMYYCPQRAINMTDEYELSTIEKSNLMLKYAGGGECHD